MSFLTRNSVLRSFLALCLLPLLVTAPGCSRQSGASKGRPPRAVPVTVEKVSQKTVALQLIAIGNVQAFQTVSVKSLIPGEIMAVHFTEGRDVRKGDPLFSIDPRSYQAALRQAEGALGKDTAQVKQAEANLAKDTAQAKNARVQADRYKSLVERQLVSKEQYDQMMTSAESLEAVLEADRAAVDNARAAVRASKEAVENARIQLDYCSIRAPIGGRTGSVLVHAGNTVKANDSSLAVINQITPVYVTFSLPEQGLPQLRRHMAAQKLRVEARIPNDPGPAEEGALTFVDNAIDNSTGTIQLKGSFPNRSERLWPGQFVNVTVILGSQPDALVAPSKAVQTGQQGQFVFVVKPNSTVEARPVIVDRAIGEETILKSGVKPGETVVTDGQFQLVPGAKVQIKGSGNDEARRRKPA
jgi:membrane fusion protein, multidrug efflux system